MSELINNQRKRIEELKVLLKKMQASADIETVKTEIGLLLKSVPHEDVIIAEQELIAEGTPLDKMLELCDIHSRALHGLLVPYSKELPLAHPATVFKKENLAFKREIELINILFTKIRALDSNVGAGEIFIKIHAHFNNLMDVEKHYSRKENLVFPFLEKYQITGPSTVMWGKDDQVRKLLKDAIAVLLNSHTLSAGEGMLLIGNTLEPVIAAILDMIQKEEEILIPMSLDVLTDIDWYEIYKQSDGIGFALIEVREEWAPEGFIPKTDSSIPNSRIQLPTGNFATEELIALFSHLPVDLTFVDKDDYVRFFTEGPDRIFQRSRAIIGRKVQFCHPPHSVAIVEQILNDFKSGKQKKADFHIQLHGKFIYICYYALLDDSGAYLGTLEVSQDLTYFRSLEGEKRILSYGSDENHVKDSSPEITETTVEPNVVVYDARPDLANGVHPAEKVITALLNLADGEKYRLITPFPPVPLIMKAKERGFRSEETRINDAEFHTLFFK